MSDGPPTQPATTTPTKKTPSKTTQTVKAALRLLVALAIIAAVVFFAHRALAGSSQDALTLVQNAEPWRVAVAAVCIVVVMVGNGVILKLLVAHFGVELSAKVWLGVTFVATMLNYISPLSGAGAMRGLYLKRAHGVSYEVFVAVVTTSFVFSLTCSAGLGAASLLALGLPGGHAGLVTLIASLAIVASPLLLWLLPSSSSSSSEATTRWQRLKQRLLRLAVSWRGVTKKPALMLLLLLTNVVAVVAHGFAFVMAFRIAGFEGSIFVPLASSAFARIATLFAITPAGLGIYEAFGAVSAQLVGADAGPALLGVLVVRVVSTVVNIAGGLCFSPLLVRFRALNASADAADSDDADSDDAAKADA